MLVGAAELTSFALGAGVVGLIFAWRGRKVKHLHDSSSIREEFELLQGRYRILTDNIAAAIIIRDLDRNIVYASPYTEVLFGYPLKDVYDRQTDFFARVVHPDDQALSSRAIAVSLSGEAFQYRFRFFHRTGIEMSAESRSVPIIGDNGELISTLSVTLDVTASVLQQRQMEERNRDLQDFTSMVSHDLKGPLFTIRGMLTALKEDFHGTIPTAVSENLAHIERAAEKLELLVRSILDYSKLTAEQTSSVPVPLSSLVNELLMELEPSLRTRAAKVEVLGELPIVLGDKTHLYRIFSNLVGNALKYVDPQRPAHVQISASDTPNPHQVAISVRDNGLGIPCDKFDVIFRPFQRVHKGVAEGSGIGLASVKRLVEKLGGSVRVESTVGQGSCFTIVLRRSR